MAPPALVPKLATRRRHLISPKLGHQVAPFVTVPNLATKLHRYAVLYVTHCISKASRNCPFPHTPSDWQMRLMTIQIRKVFFQRLTNITGPTQTALPRTDSNFVAVSTDPNLVTFDNSTSLLLLRSSVNLWSALICCQQI